MDAPRSGAPVRGARSRPGQDTCPGVWAPPGPGERGDRRGAAAWATKARTFASGRKNRKQSDRQLRQLEAGQDRKQQRLLFRDDMTQ